jgi:hypothetical protein
MQQIGSFLTLRSRKLRSQFVKTTWFVAPLIIGAGSLICCRGLSAQGVQIEKPPPADQTAATAKPSASAPPAKPRSTPTPAEALFDYLQKYQLEVARFQAGTRYIWTDRMFIEITDGPPPDPLASLLAAGPNNTSQFSTWVYETFESKVKSWHPGKRNPHPAKEGTEEFVADGEAPHFFNPVYVSYVLSRYPTASILLKGPLDPALFTVNGQVRAVVSPWTKLPDGTPLP